jgi:hypothetical protein
LIDCDWLRRTDVDPGADYDCVISDAGDGDAGPDEGSIGARPPDNMGSATSPRPSPSPGPPGHDVRALDVTQDLVYLTTPGVNTIHKRCGPKTFPGLACSGRMRLRLRLRRPGATAMVWGPRRGWTATMTSMWGGSGAYLVEDRYLLPCTLHVSLAPRHLSDGRGYAMQAVRGRVRGGRGARPDAPVAADQWKWARPGRW